MDKTLGFRIAEIFKRLMFAMNLARPARAGARPTFSRGPTGLLCNTFARGRNDKNVDDVNETGGGGGRESIYTTPTLSPLAKIRVILTRNSGPRNLSHAENLNSHPVTFESTSLCPSRSRSFLSLLSFGLNQSTGWERRCPNDRRFSYVFLAACEIAIFRESL